MARSYALKTIVASDDVRPGDVRLHQCLRLVSNSALGRRASRKFLGGGLLVVLRQLMFSVRRCTEAALAVPACVWV